MAVMTKVKTKTKTMIDYLLKFKNKDQAVKFADDNGFTSVVEEEGGEKINIIEQGDGYVFTTIGEHWVDTGKTKKLRDETGTEWEQPVMKSDKNHWVLFRDVHGDMDPTPAKKFIVWSSDMTEKVRARNEDGEFEPDDPDTPEDEAWVEQPVPRPENAPNRVFL
jgi:hypothetical protein